MKKNLMSVIIVTMCLVNLVLSAIIVFTLLPGAKKVNALIEKVGTALELENLSGAASGPDSIPLDKQEIYAINAGENMTITLKSNDADNHYLVCKVTLSINKESSSYNPSLLAEQDSVIQDTISSIVSQYTADEAKQNMDNIKEDILVILRDRFGKDYIISVNFAAPLYS